MNQTYTHSARAGSFRPRRLLRTLILRRSANILPVRLTFVSTILYTCEAEAYLASDRPRSGPLCHTHGTSMPIAPRHPNRSPFYQRSPHTAPFLPSCQSLPLPCRYELISKAYRLRSSSRFLATAFAAIAAVLCTGGYFLPGRPWFRTHDECAVVDR